MLKQPSDEESRRFRLANRKKLYKGGKLDQPFFCLGEVHHRTVLCGILYTRGRIDSRQVVTAEQAYQIVLKLHQDVHSNTCKPGGINAIVAQFTMTYYCGGIRSNVEKLLKECRGTYKLSKPIETKPPPPKAMRTLNVMEVYSVIWFSLPVEKDFPAQTSMILSIFYLSKTAFQSFVG